MRNDVPGELYLTYGSHAEVSYTDIEGGWSGTGNINADPRFVHYMGYDDLFHRDSPCIDAGDPALDDGFDWPDWYPNGPHSDMGAYGGPGNVGWLPNR